MTKKIRIKDIAEMADVSPGTVDRILHNRGNVSAEARTAVEKVLKQVNYKPNIHISALSLKKRYTIVATIPQFQKGEYWEITQRGILRAIKEYENVKIKCVFCCYDQYDINSCRKTFEEVLGLRPDGVIIGPTFTDETIEFASQLKELEIPFVYVDSTIDGTMPIASFSSDQFRCGYLSSKMITSITPSDSEYVVFQAVRIGDGSSITSLQRKAGFLEYCRECGKDKYVHSLNFSVMEPERNKELINDFFTKHPNARGVVVLNSKGDIVADYINKNGLGNKIKLVCIDLTDNNIEKVKTGEIDFIIAQRPQQQGFIALETLIQFLIYRNPVMTNNYLPLDIVTKENLDFYSDF